MKITSPAFLSGELIPAIFTCDGENIAPPLEVWDVPAEAMSLALIVEGPDSSSGSWTHWLLWNIPPNVGTMPSRMIPPGSNQGLTSFGGTGYGGPCPASGRHRYFFRLFALDTRFDLGQSSRRAELERAMIGHIMAEAELVGLYERKKK